MCLAILEIIFVFNKSLSLQSIDCNLTNDMPFLKKNRLRYKIASHLRLSKNLRDYISHEMKHSTELHMTNQMSKNK